MKKIWPKIAGLACGLVLLSASGRAADRAAIEQLADLAGTQASAKAPDEGLTVTDGFILALAMSAHRDMGRMGTPEKLRGSLQALLARLDAKCVKRASELTDPAKKRKMLWAHENVPPVLRRALDIEAGSVAEYVDRLDRAFDTVDSTVREARTPDDAAQALDRLFRK